MPSVTLQQATSQDPPPHNGKKERRKECVRVCARMCVFVCVCELEPPLCSTVKPMSGDNAAL